MEDSAIAYTGRCKTSEMAVRLRLKVMLEIEDALTKSHNKLSSVISTSSSRGLQQRDTLIFVTCTNFSTTMTLINSESSSSLTSTSTETPSDLLDLVELSLSVTVYPP